jgi:HPt (histidine-containing phosphotransfer) domain-containing protein
MNMQATPTETPAIFDGRLGNRQLIDRPFLKSQTMDRVELAMEILEMFRAQMQQHLEQLNHLEEGPLFKVRIHTIKGASHGVGASKLAQLATTIEKTWMVDSQTQPAQVVQLKTLMQETIDEIDGILKAA